MDEISRLPPEAIARVDILPEEVALAYGYRADQRVVNIVLERQFKATTVEASTRFPTGGGRTETAISGNVVKINSKGRMSLDLDYGRDSMLTEAERDLPGNDARYRTLLSGGEKLGLGATISRNLDVLGGINATLNGRLDRKTGTSLFGLPLDPLAPGPLAGHTRSTTGRLGLTLNGGVGSWTWSMTSAFDQSHTLSRTDRDASGGGVSRDRVESSSRSISSDGFANGPIADLPAGKLSATVRAALSRGSLESTGLFSGVEQHRDDASTQAQVSANINLPIASRKKKVLTALGDLSANINVAHSGISGLGGADTIGAGVSWSPIPALRLSASLTRANGLPPQAQRENPIVTTPNVPVFDFVNGETIEVARIDGGNPDLEADSRKILSLSGRLKPLSTSSLTLNIGYSQSRTRNQVGALPAVTAAIEAAFPERFTRDGSGRLVSVDARPVNFARAEQKQLSWGLFWSKDLGRDGAEPAPSRRPRSSPSPQFQGVAGADEEMAAEAMQAEQSGPGGMAGRRMGMAGNKTRVLLSFNHIWQIQNDLLIREGLPVLDLLDGEAFGARGQARHQLSARGNLMRHGLGATIEARWQSGSRLKGSTTDLTFSDLATVNLRLFANLGQMKGLSGKHPFFKGSRFSLDVVNLFDGQVRVRDSLGLTPASFDPSRLDPLGRTVKLSFRKLF
jgi:hypothetical protein